MSAPVIGRTAWIDDDGSGTTGTVINNAVKTSIYDQIDALAATLYTVPGGGTGVATLTNHGVVLGQGTAAVAVTGAGTSGQVLTSNGASSDPTFQTLSTGIPNPIVQDLLFTDATYDIGKSGATRPRDGFFSRNVVIGGTLGVTGVAAFTAAPTVANGLQFPATQSAQSDANNLDDYEEGTWTPTDTSGAGLSFSGVSAAYVKIGQLVVAGFEVVYPSTGNGSAAKIGTLPFTAFGTPTNGWTGVVGYTDSSIDFRFLVSGTNLFPYKTDGTQPTNANLSGKSVRGIAIYRASA